MRDGISVYGGFKGNETSKSQRLTYQFPWETEKDQSTVYLVAKEYNNKPVLADNRSEINSSSRHVVWFAPATYSDAQRQAFTRLRLWIASALKGDMLWVNRTATKLPFKVVSAVASIRTMPTPICATAW